MSRGKNRNNVHSLSGIKWSPGKNLIYNAYQCGRSLLASGNLDLAFDTGSDWKDYVTSQLSELSLNRTCPMSFGISVKGDNWAKYKITLEVLVFLRIERFLMDILREYSNENYNLEGEYI